MGGYNSGRRGGPPAVEDALTLGLSRLLRRGTMIPGAWSLGTLTWTATQSGEHMGSVGYEADLRAPAAAWLRLRYTTTRYRDGVKRSHDYRVRLTTTVPQFGGLRWWFVCPLTGTRAAKLHLPNGADLFASRRAYGLPYRSQRLGGMDVTHARQARIVEKMGGVYHCPDEGPPRRPKWMRHRTYDRLCAELEAAEAEHDRVFIEGAARIVAMAERSRRRW